MFLAWYTHLGRRFQEILIWWRKEKVARLEQECRSKVTSLGRNPTDSWTLVRALQPLRINVSRFFIVEKSGISINCPQSANLMDLRHLKFWNPAPSHLKLLPLKLTSLSFFRPNLNSSDEKEHPSNSIHLSPEGRQRSTRKLCTTNYKRSKTRHICKGVVTQAQSKQFKRAYI